MAFYDEVRQGFKAFWLGTNGPHLYDPNRTHKNGDRVRAFRGDLLEVLAQVLERGDIILGLTDERAAVLLRGEPGQVLVVNPFAPAGVEWASLVGGIPVLSTQFYWLSPFQYLASPGPIQTALNVWLSPEQYTTVFAQTLPPVNCWLSPEQYITTPR